ncbi:bifunctional oligoribonuclease/PAP phosphatase NrnA [Brevibacillus sp. MCWH]|jgi:bifunctional oligoribonuclease and PAP phosphatase NrnA|uniref:DHH family phosphoesterase n=1 Tax=Brevibacillus sp. MCWH TaxID=2508871 RepID=UPI0014929893|nr:bifunctional oligoribonuclease/PAP phosphatase NrnA [Brevibacillus sp. MCWH]NNV01851.1 bifunctional oligoribonuclease/PAP phosphatase NrnA [Brevibacillus sp. MCWH]
MTDYRRALEEAVRFLREHDRFLILSHVNPDGDAIGSTLAVAAMLEQLGKSYVLVNESGAPDKFSFLPRFERICNLSQDLAGDTFSAVIAVDCADASRMGDVRHLFAPDAALLNIDHHPTNDAFGAVNVIRTDAAATAEILYDLNEAAGLPITEDFALCIYTGLLTDTGGFRYSNTSPYNMEIAARLLRYGVNPGDVAERCLEVITLSHVKLLRQALQTLRMSHGNLVASVFVSRQDLESAGADREDAGGLVNYCRNIEGVEVGVSFVEAEPGTVKVSLRARSRVDVSEIAKQLGGGGHAKAAGCTLRGTLAEAQERVWNALGQALGVNADE